MKFDDVQPELLQAWQNDPVTRAFVNWLEWMRAGELVGMVAAVRGNDESSSGKASHRVGSYDALGNVIAKIEVKR